MALADQLKIAPLEQCDFFKMALVDQLKIAPLEQGKMAPVE